MCLKLDNIFFVELVWILALIGIVVSSWYTLTAGFPYVDKQCSLFGLNPNMIYLFMFAVILWELYNMKYPKEHRKEEKKKSRRK